MPADLDSETMTACTAELGLESSGDDWAGACVRSKLCVAEHSVQRECCGCEGGAGVKPVDAKLAATCAAKLSTSTLSLGADATEIQWGKACQEAQVCTKKSGATDDGGEDGDGGKPSVPPGEEKEADGSKPPNPNDPDGVLSAADRDAPGGYVQSDAPKWNALQNTGWGRKA